VETVTGVVANRPRAYVRVQGPGAEEFLQRMLSNDVAREVCDALLLTPKARVIAPLRVWRRAADDFLLLTEPELGERVRAALLRARFASKVEIEVEEHSSVVVFGDGTPEGIPNADYGEPASELVDAGLKATMSDEELEVMRILAGTPRFGREIDDRVLPAEAGLVRRAVSFTKGCYPGQEPIARLHYRGHANRGLRVLELTVDELPGPDAELTWDGKVVGRVTSAARDGTRIVALAYVRVEVPEDAELELGTERARPLDSVAARP
jgi:folate-binding protein YgfZ